MTQLKTVLEIEGYKIEFALSKAVLLQIMILNYLIIINEEATKLGLTVFSQRANLEGENFSCFQEHVKGAMFNLGTGIGSSSHNGEFKVEPDALK